MGLGLLGITVWPVYLGIAAGDPGPGPVAAHEPWGDIDYSRGQITWRTHPDGTVTGSASMFVPKGIWSHLVFFRGPSQEHMVGSTAMDQPVIFDRAGIIEIDPIQNQDYLPRLPA